jgi:hypothetical protein
MYLMIMMDMEEDGDELEPIMVRHYQLMRIIQRGLHIPRHFTAAPTFGNFENFSLEYVRLHFRFDKWHLEPLFEAWVVPERIRLSNRAIVPGKEAFLIMIYCLVHSERFVDMEDTIGRDETIICRIYNTMLDAMYNAHHHLVTDNMDYFKSRMKECQRAILKKVKWMHANFPEKVPIVPVFTKRICGFIDATERRCCRTSDRENYQQVLFSGKGKKHCLKYQGWTVPFGLIGQLYGPKEGLAHDQTLCRLSNINQIVSNCFPDEPLEEQPASYTDRGYYSQSHIIAQHKRARGQPVLPELFEQENRALKVCRAVGVEWPFGMVQQQFPAMNVCGTQKVFDSQIAKQYVVSVLLMNSLCCLKHNAVSEFYNMTPPTLHDYFNQIIHAA